MMGDFFDLNHWEDIFSHLKKHKLRTGLTAFGVFWGIFLLLVMLGAGKGIERGVYLQFGRMAVNSVHVWGGQTSLAYRGHNPGRSIQLTDQDTQALRRNIPGIEIVCPRIQMWQSSLVKVGDLESSFTIRGEIPEIMQLEPLDMLDGRFINARDMLETRKMAVIGKRVRQVLFPGGDSPVGQYIQINGVNYLVCGVFDYDTLGGDERGRSETILLPFTTMQRSYNMMNRVGWYSILLSDQADTNKAEEEIKSLLADRHDVHPDDNRAIGSWNSSREFKSLQGLFSGINVFLWIVGMGTLLAGMIGVSNIMLIIVKERTREIGIRKTLGATPASIISMILQEAFLITSVAGYSGVVLAIGLMEGIAWFMKKSQLQSEYFSDPEVSLGVALSAMVLLVLAGILAGLFPALKAASIHPVEALRDE